MKGKGTTHHLRINDNIIAIDRPHVSTGWIKRGEKTVVRWRESRGGFRASCRVMTDRSSVRLPQVPPVSHSLLARSGWRGGVSAAKDTEVSAERLGNIVHQAASVMGSSL